MELVNKNVKMLDPFSQSLTQEQKELILEECKVNPQYFYESILGIKANRLTWEMIRSLQNYPKDDESFDISEFVQHSKDNPHPEAGQHYEDGSMRMADGKRLMPIAEEWTFISEGGIAAARKPGIGDFYRDTFIASSHKPNFIDEWDKLAWDAWNLTLMHFAHEMRPSKARIQARYERDWLDRAPEGVESRVDFKDDRYGEPQFEFKRNNGDWIIKLPGIKERDGHHFRRFVPSSEINIPSIKVPMTPEELKFAAITAWNEVVKEHGNHPLVTEGQLECLFDREIIKAVGPNRVQVKVRAGEPSFSYKVEGRWVPL